VTEGDAESIKLGQQLTPDQQEAIKALIANYSDVFSSEPGCTHLTEHRITVTDHRPCFQQSYRIPDALKGAVERELNDMERRGIIYYDPHATWNSPLVIVRKAGGIGLRSCNNFILLNKRTVPEPYTMSNMTELINKVAGAKYISRVDMAFGYYQIPLEAGSQRLCSFQTEWGVYSYRRMPFGLVNASSTLQRLMDHIL